jgi:hypothetical protein
LRWQLAPVNLCRLATAQAYDQRPDDFAKPNAHLHVDDARILLRHVIDLLARLFHVSKPCTIDVIIFRLLELLCSLNGCVEHGSSIFYVGKPCAINVGVIFRLLQLQHPLNGGVEYGSVIFYAGIIVCLLQLQRSRNIGVERDSIRLRCFWDDVCWLLYGRHFADAQLLCNIFVVDDPRYVRQDVFVAWLLGGRYRVQYRGKLQLRLMEHD